MTAIRVMTLLCALSLFVTALWEHNTDAAWGWGVASVLWVGLTIQGLKDHGCGGGQ